MSPRVRCSKWKFPAMSRTIARYAAQEELPCVRAHASRGLIRSTHPKLQAPLRAIMSGMRMRNIKITIAYDGSNFHGWQLQPGLPTIQGALNDAARKITQEKITVQGASRTDTG